MLVKTPLNVGRYPGVEGIIRTEDNVDVPTLGLILLCIIHKRFILASPCRPDYTLPTNNLLAADQSMR